MVIVKKLAAEFQIQLVVKHVNPIHNMLGLHFQVFLIVEADFHDIFLCFCFYSAA